MAYEMTYPQLTSDYLIGVPKNHLDIPYISEVALTTSNMGLKHQPGATRNIIPKINEPYNHWPMIRSSHTQCVL